MREQLSPQESHHGFGSYHLQALSKAFGELRCTTVNLPEEKRNQSL